MRGVRGVRDVRGVEYTVYSTPLTSLTPLTLSPLSLSHPSHPSHPLTLSLSHSLTLSLSHPLSPRFFHLNLPFLQIYRCNHHLYAVAHFVLAFIAATGGTQIALFYYIGVVEVAEFYKTFCFGIR